MVEGFDRHYRAVPRDQRRGQAALRARRLARPAARAGASASSSTTSASTRRSSACARVRRRPPCRRRLAAGQAALHRPADQPPPARAGRDLLQLGHGQAAAPQLLQQRLHLRAPGGQHRVHRERRTRRRCRPTAPTTRRARRLRETWRASSTTSSSQRPFEDLDRDVDACWQAMLSRAAAASGRAPTSRSRCCAACSTATRAPTWSARSSTASARSRSRCRSCTAPQARLVDRRRAVRRGRRCCSSSASPAPTSWSTWRCPAPTCSSCARLMPRKPRAELYTALGLQKHGKNLFYRDFLHHLRHSSDHFRIAPGIKGMVMLVFDLPSFPYVFKVIKDFYPPPKDTTREQIKGKYLLVKQHDRVGRMADTLEYSRRRLPARTLRGRADRRAAALLPQPARGGRRRARDPPPLHRAPHDPAEHLPARGHARADRARGGRVRQRHQGPGGRQHLPRRHAVEELRRHAPRQGGVLRLRRDRVHHRLQLPPRARGRAPRKRR